MAYSVKGLAIINDSRELLGVNTAGINTALYVGDLKIEDNVIEATAGVVTFIGDGSSLTGVVTVSDSGGTPEFGGDLSIDGQLSVSGLSSLGGGVDVTGHIEGDSLQISGITTLSSLEFADGVSLDGVTTDLGASSGATELVTAEAAKAYADSIVGAGNTMEFTGNTGNTGAVDLVTETFAITGDANEIVTDVAAVDGNEITIGLSDELIVPGSLQVTGLTTFASNVEYGTGVSFAFADDGNAITGIGIATDLGDTSASDAILPTQKAVKDYVDGVEASVEANAQLRLNANDVLFDQVELATENLGISQGSNMVVTGLGNTFTVALANDVALSGNLQAGIVTATGNAFVGGNLEVTGTFGFDGGQAVDAIGIATDLGDTSPLDTTIPTQKAVKEYVDSRVSGNTNSETITLADSADVDATYYIPFAASATGDEALVTDAAQLTYNPSSGLLVAQDFNSLSDIRFKENVETITDATAKLEQIRGVEFDWKNTDGSSVGVIAQEIQALYPQLVTQGEDKLTVNYNGLTGLLIQAVKELSARVEELEGKA